MNEQHSKDLRSTDVMGDQEVNELFSDVVFVKKLISMETLEEAQVVFKEKGIDVSIEYLASLREFYQTNKEELSLDDLDAIAGGKGLIFKPKLPFPNPMPNLSNPGNFPGGVA